MWVKTNETTYLEELLSLRKVSEKGKEMSSFKFIDPTVIQA